jgi:hypothetical protein
MWKPVLIILVIFAILGYGYIFLNKPTISGNDPSAIVTSSRPLQSTLVHGVPINIVIGDLDVSLQPVARYKISAMLLAKKRYVDGWAGKLTPYDIVLGWRNAGILENTENLPITQSVRHYQFTVSPSTNMTSTYISKHTSNNHIIPATKNVLKAIKSIKIYDKITLDGYLVNMSGIFKSNKINWLTSKTRNDTGAKASEIFYVKSVKIGKNIYK